MALPKSLTKVSAPVTYADRQVRRLSARKIRERRNLLILSIDPGDTTGFVLANCVDKKINLQDFGHWKYDEVYKKLCDNRTVDVLLVENYLIRDQKVARGYTHSWAKPTPLRIIGACEFIASNFHAKLVLQEPSIKPVGAAYCGWDGKPKKGEHWKDAMVHLKYYLVTKHDFPPERMKK